MASRHVVGGDRLSRHLASALTRGVGTVLVAAAVTFLLVQLVPARPLDALAHPFVPREQLERTREALGIDRPLHQRALDTVATYARGELGVSWTWRRPVADVVRAALPHTIALGGLALLLSYAVAPLVSVSLLRARGWRRATGDSLLLVLATMPRFWLGIVLVLVFHDGLSLLPGADAAPAGAGAATKLAHLVLPAATLAIPSLATLARFQLASMREGLDSPSALHARRIGLSERLVTLREAFLPSLGTTFTLLALDLPALVSGALVVEIVFSRPGIGRVAAGALVDGDYPLALATTILVASAVAGAQTLVTLLGPRLDPRRRLELVEGRR